jgi:7-cyano-7-deazaguanine synthase
MDSATCLAEAVRRGEEVHALSIEYGQRHRRETASARALARHFQVKEHTVIRLPIGPLLTSALTDPTRPIPGPSRKNANGGIPPTYVPARNTIFLSIALGYAESRGLQRIYVGVNAVDYSGYPDCRPEYLRAFDRLARLATKASVEDGRRIRIVAPLVRLTKSEIVQRGTRLGVPWDLTWSCYVGGRRPCGSCDACTFRAKGFREAGCVDPLIRGRSRSSDP